MVRVTMPGVKETTQMIITSMRESFEENCPLLGWNRICQSRGEPQEHVWSNLWNAAYKPGGSDEYNSYRRNGKPLAWHISQFRSGRCIQLLIYWMEFGIQNGVIWVSKLACNPLHRYKAAGTGWHHPSSSNGGSGCTGSTYSEYMYIVHASGTRFF